jgi:hypothetical protein
VAATVLGARGLDPQARAPRRIERQVQIHVELNIYNQGLLVTVPAHVGIDEPCHI